MSTQLANVLVVDDETEVCDVVREVLCNSGFQCMTACDPSKAKDLIDNHPFSVLLTDVVMDDITGLDLLVHTRRNKPACKVILMSGLMGSDYLEQALDLGAYDFIQKPFQPNDLTDAVSRAADTNSPSQYLAFKAAYAIEHEEQFKEHFLAGTKALIHAVEAKDPYTRRHSEHVAHYAVNLARSVSANETVIESIRIASLLHDIGKIGIPDNILTKEGPLDEIEQYQIRRHPVLGAEILENISVLAEEAKLIRHHHENWDGSGYPDGLAGEDIPFGSRVMRIADAVDAMLMTRSYKNAYSIAQTLDELQSCTATQFDPKLAKAMLDWCNNHGDELFLHQRP